MVKSSTATITQEVPPFGALAIKQKIRKEEGPHCWCLTVKLLSPLSKNIFASLKGLIVERDLMADDLHSIMDIHTQETLEFATTLFDSGGKLLSEYITNPVRRGSGVWGRELSTGSFLYIEEIFVQKENRKRGLGSYLLNYALTLVRNECPFAFAFPLSSNFPIQSTQDELDALHELTRRFFRKSGFRRVGCTSFFACSIQDSRHRSKSLPIEEDYNPPHNSTIPTPTIDELEERYPLHFAIANDLCPLRMIDELSLTKPLLIRQTDHEELLPLHIAASKGDLAVVRKLLTFGVKDVHRTTKEGFTPLQLLLKSMESERGFRRAFNLPWEGQTEEKCSLLLLLRESMGMPLPQPQPDLQLWELVKWGCSCNQCRWGWFSPRMKHKLQACSETAANDLLDFLANSMGEDQRVDELSQSNIPMSKYIQSFILPLSQSNVLPSFLKGFSCFFLIISRILQRGQKATPRVVYLELRSVLNEVFQNDVSHIARYLESGGSAEHAINAVIHRCWEETQEGSDLFTSTAQYSLLPACENDDAYQFIKTNFELDPTFEPEIENGFFDDSSSDEDLDDDSEIEDFEDVEDAEDIEDIEEEDI